MSKPIELPPRVTLAVIERVLRKNFASSVEASSVEVDASQVEWIGYYPATVLFSWLAPIALQQVPVSLKLPSHERLSKQLRTTLIDSGIATQLEEYGVRVVPPWPSNPPRGIPLTVPNSRENVPVDLSSRCTNLIERLRPDAALVPIIQQLFDVVVFELLDNAFEHGEGRLVHYGVNIATSSGPDPANQTRPDRGVSQGFMRVYPKGTPYAEIYVGDLGPGIEHTAPDPPEGYVPPFSTTRSLTKEQARIAYAFEFSTTRDQGRRAKKFQELLDASGNPQLNAVATGLFGVYALLRATRGQLIVRTPTTIIGVDSLDRRSKPRASSLAPSDISALASLPGTHYLLRIPLVILDEAEPRTRGIDLPLGDTDFLDLFQTQLAPAERLQAALVQLDAHLMARRSTRGTTVLMPALPTLPARAEAVFSTALLALNVDQRALVWSTPKFEHFAPPPSGASSSWMSLPGPPVLVGNMLSNRFVQLRQQNADSPFVSLDRETHEQFTKLYAAAVAAVVRKTICRPEIRQHGESFLFEGQYYTETYFNVAKAFDDPNLTYLAAEWILARLDTEVLIAHSIGIHPVADAVADLSKAYLGRQLVVIKTSSVPYGPTLLKDLFSVLGKRVSILTDVICTGHRLRELLEFLTGSRLSKLYAIVDARNTPSVSSLVAKTREGTVVFDPDAIVHEQIPTYADDPPPRRRTAGHPERVVVIDKRTHSPTLYVRPETPALPLLDLLQHLASIPDVLHLGHLSYQDEHFTAFMDFPKLFDSLRQRILDWILEQMAFVSRTADYPWTVALFDPDDSLHWIRDQVGSSQYKPTLKSVKYDDLRAPFPPRATSDIVDEPERNHWLLVMPAASSGDSERMFIEFASRFRPRSILLLCVVSRFKPQQLDFHTGITRYRDAQFRMACFTHFPVSGSKGDGSCPRCRLFERVSRLLPKAAEILNPESPLMLALSARVEALRQLPLGDGNYASQLQSLASVTDSTPAELRVLYAAAEFDIDIRRGLNSRLQDDSQLDLFLSVFADEIENSDFAVEKLQKVLYKVYPRLLARIQEILEREHAPFPLGRVLGAAMHLVPFTLTAKAADLVSRFKSSQRDLADLAVALVLSGIEPDLSSVTENVGLQLLDNVRNVLRHSRTLTKKDVAASLQAMGSLWARLRRSSEFSDPLATLVEHQPDDYRTLDAAKTAGHRVWREWSTEMGPLVNRIQTGPLWQRLLHNCPSLPLQFAILGNRAATLERIASLPDDAFRTRMPELYTVATETNQVAVQVANQISAFFISPLHSSIVRLTGEMTAVDNQPIKIEKQFDYYSPRLCCDLNDLDEACSQLFQNWRKHSHGTGRQAICRVTRTDFEVVLSFGDNWGGEFDMGSGGGLAVVQRFVNGYGGNCSVRASDGFKWIELALPALDAFTTSESSKGIAKAKAYAEDTNR